MGSLGFQRFSSKPIQYSQMPPDNPTTDEPAESPPTPRWVKIFLVVLLLIILVAAVLLLTSIGGEHGPGRHAIVMIMVILPASGCEPAFQSDR